MVPAHATAFDIRDVTGTAEHFDLQDIHDFAVDVALKAGALVRRTARRQYLQSRSNAPSTSKIEIKASEVDLVTNLDVQIEELIRCEIESRWPNHEITAEESYAKRHGTKGKWKRNRGPTWHIDPLDGTMNFTHTLQIYCVSIGFFCSHDDEATGLTIEDDALVGAIYAPMLGSMGTLWSGARGHGSYLSYPKRLPSPLETNICRHGCSLAELKASVAATQSEDYLDSMQSLPTQQLPITHEQLSTFAPSGILFASEWGKDRRSKRDENGQLGNLSNKTDTFINLAANDAFRDPNSPKDSPIRHVHGFRSIGSSALDLAFVAQGSVDVLWEGGCWEWDVCAGIAILLEAGGIVTDSNPPAMKSSHYWNVESRLPRAVLGGRRFLAVQACPNSIEGKPSIDLQEDVAREIWKRTKGLNYKREGGVYAIENDDSNPDATGKSTSSVRQWEDPLRERKRLTKEEAESLKANGNGHINLEHDESGVFGGRLLDKGQDQWSHNAWDHVEPPESYLMLIEEKVAKQRETKVSNEQAETFHLKPASYWNDFYQHHENRFFKDRKWLHLEFPELIKASLDSALPTRILEVGCGAGNTVFPLLQINKNPQLELFACDYSSEAVSVVKSNPLYENPTCGSCQASVWDLTSCTAEGNPIPPQGIEPHSLDIVVAIFVLSALHPNEWKRAVANIRLVLKKGGLVLIRDYGRHDLPQLRFGKNRMLADNFYVRGDGTRVYFFQPQEFLDIFKAIPESQNGHKTNEADQDYIFETLQLAIDQRMLLNRKEKKQMFRNWLQAKFKLISEE